MQALPRTLRNRSSSCSRTKPKPSRPTFFSAAGFTTPCASSPAISRARKSDDPITKRKQRPWPTNFEMPPQTAERKDAWDDAEAMLDDVLDTLDAPTRGLIILRYFEGKTAGEVATRLNISEDAARKRVNRAVEQLRDLFARRGVVMSATALAESLAAKTIIHAPAHLAASAASAAMSSAAASSGRRCVGRRCQNRSRSHGRQGKSHRRVDYRRDRDHRRSRRRRQSRSLFFLRQPTSPGAARTMRVAPAGAGPVTGVVRDPAGVPLAGAETAASSAREMRSTSISPPAGNTQQCTATPTALSSTQQAGHHFELVVRCPQGFAQVSSETLAKSTDITSPAGAESKGRVMAGTTPHSQRRGLHLRSSRPVRFHDRHAADADFAPTQTGISSSRASPPAKFGSRWKIR